MAGIKISNLKPYSEVFHDEYLSYYINEMIIPVSLGNKTISVKFKDLVNYISENTTTQTQLDEQQNQIFQNSELINNLSNYINEQLIQLKEKSEQDHNNIKEAINENEKITALSLIDLNEVTKEITENLSNLKEESYMIHKQITDQQKEKDAEQDEKINSFTYINLWEIYNDNN